MAAAVPITITIGGALHPLPALSPAPAPGPVSVPSSHLTPPAQPAPDAALSPSTPAAALNLSPTSVAEAPEQCAFPAAVSPSTGGKQSRRKTARPLVHLASAACAESPQSARSEERPESRSEAVSEEQRAEDAALEKQLLRTKHSSESESESGESVAAAEEAGEGPSKRARLEALDAASACAPGPLAECAMDTVTSECAHQNGLVDRSLHVHEHKHKHGDKDEDADEEEEQEEEEALDLFEARTPMSGALSDAGESGCTIDPATGLPLKRSSVVGVRQPCMPYDTSS